MESGISAEIIEVEHEDEEETPGVINNYSHGRVLVLIRSLFLQMDKEGAEQISSIIETLSEKLEKREADKKKRNQLLKQRNAKKKEMARLKRILKFEVACVLHPNLRILSNMVRLWFTSPYVFSERTRVLQSVLLALAVELV